VFDYLRGRVTLKRVYVLIDARHGVKAIDGEVMDLLDRAAVSYQIVLTKADKIKPPAVEALLAQTLATIKKRPAAYPEVLATSSEKGAGIDGLRAAIMTAIAS
jgi:GTP-binding protein